MDPKDNENDCPVMKWIEEQQKRYEFFLEPQTQQHVLQPKNEEFSECPLGTNL